MDDLIVPLPKQMCIRDRFKLVDNSDGIYAKLDVYYRNYAYESTADALQAFRKPEKVIETVHRLTRFHIGQCLKDRSFLRSCRRKRQTVIKDVYKRQG